MVFVFSLFTKQSEGDVVCPPVPAPEGRARLGGCLQTKEKGELRGVAGATPVPGPAASELWEAQTLRVTPAR